MATTATGPVDVDVEVVLLLTEQSSVEDFGHTASVAIDEASRLYTSGDGGCLTIPVDGHPNITVRPRFTRRYAGPIALGGKASELDEARLRQLMDEVVVSSTDALSRTGTARLYVDQRALIALVGEALDIAVTQRIVVTDRVLQPPPTWRYSIWDAVAGGVAVSYATVDPTYWGDRADLDERRKVVKRRLRAALCSVFGSCIGLVRCENPQCFLYSDIDRVTRLDDLSSIGEEHRVDALTGRGFREGTSGLDPDEVDPVERPTA